MQRIQKTSTNDGGCHPPPSTRPRQARGISLMELLVAMAVGAIILLGISNLFVTGRVGYQIEENLARVQESGRFALEQVARGVRGSRSLDCYNVLRDQPDRVSVKACQLRTDDCNEDADLYLDHHIGSTQPLGYDNGARTDDASWLDGLPEAAQDAISDAWLRGDVLVTWGIEGAGSRVTAPVGNPADSAVAEGQIQLPGGAQPQSGFALISDCEQADLFAVQSYSSSAQSTQIGHDRGDGLNAINRLSRFYNFTGTSNAAAETDSAGRPLFEARVFPFRYEVYFICCVDTNDGSLQTNTSTNNCRTYPDQYRPNLCRYDLGAPPNRKLQALVPDVADLRLTFSGEGSGSTSAFAADDTAPIPTAKWVSDEGAWSRVTGIKVEFLVASPDDNLRSDETGFLAFANDWPPAGNAPNPDDRLGFDLLPATGDADRREDRRLYQRFVTNLAVRSRTRWYLP